MDLQEIKIELVNCLIADYFECVPDDDDTKRAAFSYAMLCAIDRIISFKPSSLTEGEQKF